MNEMLRKLAIQEWKMYSGFKYNESKIREYKNAVAKLAKKEIKNVEDVHHRLWLLDIIADREQSDLFLKQIRERAKLSYGKINYANWKVWLPKSKPHERKKVIDHFMKKGGLLEKIIKQRYAKISKTYSKYGENVLDAYITTEGINYRKFLKKISQEGKKHKKILDKIWDEFNIEKEYWNEYYYLSNIVYKDIKFKLEPIPYIKKIYKTFNIPFSKIKVDDKDRKTKFGFAYCFWPNPPYDVRVSYKPVGGFNVFETAFHEFGHAAHALSMDASLPFWKRFSPPNGVSETFSELFESISTNKTYLNDLDIKDVRALMDRIKFSEAKFLTFYVANSLVKFLYWGGEIKFDEIGSTYSSLLKKYTGLEIPEKYWVLHHIISEFSIYAPSYIIAYFRKEFLLNKLKKFGRRWWENPNAGGFIKNYMAPAYDAISMFKGVI